MKRVCIICFNEVCLCKFKKAITGIPGMLKGVVNAVVKRDP